jgi:hypothetical protein
MPPTPVPAPFTDADYELIAAAVLETARGRWFLDEYARRNRQADTRMVLDAIARLERLFAQRSEGPEPDQVRIDLVEMMDAINRTKVEIAAIRPAQDSASHFGHASSELDAIVSTTEKATSDILASAERVQEIAWTLREQGVDAGICDLLDTNATEVYTACSFQDLTGQRIRKVIEVLAFLEARINTMIKIWRLDDLEFVSADDARLARPHPASGNGLEQDAVDEILGGEPRQDVIWRDSRLNDGNDRRNLGDFDLEDLEVFEAAPAVEPPAPSAPAKVNGAGHHAVDTAHDAGRKQSAPQSASKSETIDSLSFADRMALFA